MIKIGICDDDRKCLEQAKNIIEKILKDFKITAELFCYENGDSLLSKVRVFKFDMIFLDIFMPLLSGMDTAREIREVDRDVLIIFLTSSPDFALESYTVKANDYLLKPVTYENVRGVFEYYIAKFQTEPDHLILKTGNTHQKMYMQDIEYIEAQNKHCVCFLSSKKSYEVTDSLRNIENMLLCREGFFKCHRSYIVSMQHVDHFYSNEIITKNGHRIPIARGMGKAFSEAYFSFLFPD